MNRESLIKNLRGILWFFALAAGIFTIGYLIQGRSAPAKQGEIAKLIGLVPLPPNSEEQPGASFQKWSNGMVRRSFTAMADPNTVVDFYNRTLPLDGWRAASQQGSLSAFCKNGHPLLVRSLGKTERGLYEYSLTVNWGLDSPC